MSLDYVSNQEIVQAARRNLSQDVWDYLTGGAESETTMRRNRFGFDRSACGRACWWTFPSRSVDDFSRAEAAHPGDAGAHRLAANVHAGGGVAVAKAAAEFGTINFVSSVTEPSLEEMPRAPTMPKFFQLYVCGDLDWCAGIIGRAKKAGYMALCLTVDAAHYSRRDGRCSTAGSRRAAPGPDALIKRCSPGRWPRR